MRFILNCKTRRVSRKVLFIRRTSFHLCHAPQARRSFSSVGNASSAIQRQLHDPTAKHCTPFSLPRTISSCSPNTTTRMKFSHLPSRISLSGNRVLKIFLKTGSREWEIIPSIWNTAKDAPIIAKDTGDFYESPSPAQDAASCAAPRQPGQVSTGTTRHG